MKSIIFALLAISFATFAPLNAMQTNLNTSTDFVVAENIIEAVNEIDIISLNVLLAEGASVDTVDNAGNSPLMLAAKIGNPKMIDIILAHNPEINRRNNNGETALMIAAKSGILQNVASLVSAGADSEMRNQNGYSSVQIAQRYGHSSVIQFLNGKQYVSISR